MEQYGYDEIQQAAAVIKTLIPEGPVPEIGIVLGSGLARIAQRVKDAVEVPYADVPHMGSCTAPGHEGKFIIGTIGDKRVIVMQGRLHLYEGHPCKATVFPIRVMGALGVTTLIVTNAAGGIDPSLTPGTIMAIDDHINFLSNNPLTGVTDERMGTRFPDMTHAYDRDLRALADKTAAEMNLRLAHGVYIAVPGPSFETPAEIRAFGVMGADAVGMSTVLEVIVARHLGMRVLGLSMISNAAAGILDKPITSEEVNETAERCGHELSDLICNVIAGL